jgi:TolB protein
MGKRLQPDWIRAFCGITLAWFALLLLACSSSSDQQIVFVSESDGDPEIFMLDIGNGTAVQLTENNARDFGPVWSEDREKIAYLTDESGNLEINQIDRNGAATSRLTPGESIDANARPVWSPDGDRLAFVSQREGNPELYVRESDRVDPTRITFNQAQDRLGDWSPDGEWLVFYATDADSEPGLWLRNPNGVNLIRLTQGKDSDAVWSPDGEGIAFVRNQDDNQDVYIVTKLDAGTWRDNVNELRLTQAPEPDVSPVWSPDSDSLAFVSFRDGNAEIYTMRADGVRQQRLTNNGQDDLDPVWSPDGRKIAFVSYLYGPGDIFVTDAEGSNQQRLTNNNSEENSPDW